MKKLLIFSSVTNEVKFVVANSCLLHLKKYNFYSAIKFLFLQEYILL